ncbi:MULTISPECIES: hypothetical protein [Pseudomonas]|nr:MULTISPECIES: hypothetical protein [Pseudomonas]
MSYAGWRDAKSALRYVAATGSFAGHLEVFARHSISAGAVPYENG